MSDCVKAQSLSQRVDNLEAEVKAALKGGYKTQYAESEIQKFIKEIENAEEPFLLKTYVPPQMVPPSHRKEILELESLKDRLTVMIRVIAEVYPFPDSPTRVQTMLGQLFLLRVYVEQKL